MKPRLTSEILPGVQRFRAQMFYGEEVGVYLVEMPEHVVLIDIPVFTPEAVAFVHSFEKPIEAIGTHGPTIISDTVRWQREVGVRVALHEKDRNDIWLRGAPDRLFSEKRHRVGRLEVIHTPGHSDGSVCILDPVTGALFTGDTVAATPRGMIRDLDRDSTHDTDSSQRILSAKNLCNETFSSILPFHYSPLIGEAHEALKRYLSKLNRRRTKIKTTFCARAVSVLERGGNLIK
jgi:glyoxylase-like metal-dependent hydrolase (beta-lactamase superfamily II)